MDTKQFIASLVSSLAWPAAVLVIALVFRRQLVQLLTTGPLRRLRMGAVEAEFERRTAEVETKLELGPLGKPVSTEALAPATLADELIPAPSTVLDELTPVAEVSPSAAVLEAFSRVQQDLQARLEAAGFSRADQSWGVVGLARRARAGGLIKPQAQEAVEGVAVLRNLAAHNPGEVSRETALEYLALIDGVLFALRSGGNND